MGLLGGDTRINATFTATDRATPVIKGLRSNISALGTKTGGPLGGLLGGLGGLNLGMVGAVGVGVGFVGMLADATKAAIDEDKGIAQLNASLKANVPGWQGQTAAVQAAIDAAEKLAFTDDAARNSMALLLPATHSVAKAVELQAIAMNLARLRGTDLVETSTLISKVYQGNLSSLKRFGISLKGVSNSTEALSKIQELAAGQAEAYANTTAGHYEQIQIKINDLKEDIGHALQPVIDVALQGMTELFNPPTTQTTVLDGLVEANLKAAASTGNLNAATDQISKSFNDLASQTGSTTNFVIDFGQALLSGNGDAQMAAILLGKYGEKLGLTTDQLSVYVSSATKAGLTFEQMQGQLNKLVAQEALHNRMLEQGTSNADAAAASTDRVTAAQARYAAQLKALAHRPGSNVDLLGMPKKQTVEQQAEGIGKAFSGGIQKGLEANVNEVAQASADLKWAIKHPLAVLQGKGGFGWIVGELTSKGLKKGLQSHNPEIRAAAERKRQILHDELAGLPSYAWGSKVASDYLAGLRAAGLLETPFGWGVRFNTGIKSDWTWHVPGYGNGHKAGGGPVRRGETYIVGENGPEVLHMGSGATSGYVTQGRGSGGGTMPDHFDLILNGEVFGRLVARGVDRSFGQGWSAAGSSTTRN